MRVLTLQTNPGAGQTSLCHPLHSLRIGPLWIDLASKDNASLRLNPAMNPQEPVRTPFVEPVVSEPIDALDATRAFGGLLGQIVLGGGSSGTAIDDGDFCVNGYYYDSTGQDSVDPYYSCP